MLHAHPAFSKTCSLEGCGAPSLWTPEFEFRPPAAFNYSGEPIRAQIGIALCDDHRVWFLEAGWRELAEGPKGLAAVIRQTGRPVDDLLTAVRMLALPGAP